ncbi:MAG TPA: VWA domain-containing protein [Thermoanaerobaculia bacterium]|nr:VWA domain-containing protein [Thermoanaerobaculia bacterium]
MAAPLASRRGGLAIVLCLALVALAPALAAQAPAAQEGFSEQVQVDVVNVDAFVTDKAGNPVPGLQKKDFEIREDGKRVDISNFEAVDRGAEPAAPAASQDDPQMPSMELTLGAAPADAMQLVVYIDNFNLRPANRARVLRQLREFLTRELRPSDRVMLVTYDLGMQVRLPFTTDRAALGRALDGVGLLAANGSEAERARQAAIQQILDIQERTKTTDHMDGRKPGGRARSGGSGGGGGEGGEGEEGGGDSALEIDPLCPLDIAQPARSYAETSRQQILGNIAALKVMVNSLSGLPGRKTLLHVSDGISVTPGEELFQALFELCGGGGVTSGLSSSQAGGMIPVDTAALGNTNSYQGRNAMIDAQAYSTATEWSALAAHANTQRVTLYTLQASGLEAPASSSAEAGPSDRMLHLGSVATIEMQNRQSSLSVMAADTGGRATFNANDVRPALARMRDDFDRYYSLGFTPRHSGDGREHRIEVRVKRKGLQVRHPLSYRDKPAMERAVDRTLAALFFGSEDNPLDVSLEIGEVTPGAQGGYTVPVRLRIPLQKMFFRQTEEAYEGRLRLLVATQSGSGGTSKVRQVQVPVKVPKDMALIAFGQFYVYELALNLGPGEQRVAVAVRDEGTAQTSFLARGLRVGGSDGAVRGQF